MRFRSVLLCGFLLLAPLLSLAQVIPDSTTGGKGKIKQQSPHSDTVITPAPPRDTVDRDTAGADNFGKLPGTAPRVTGDTVMRNVPERHYDPKVAVRRSLLLPGLGQIYNRSWWKVPIIYAGFGAFAYFITDNHSKYLLHRNAARCYLDPDCNEASDYPDFAGFTVDGIISIREFHRRFRDLNIIFASLWYTLQAIDAYVEAHLKEFTVSEDLSLRVKPTLNMDPFLRSNVLMGATISIRLRK